MRRWLIVVLLLGCLGIVLPAGAQGGETAAITPENAGELTQLPTFIVPPQGVVAFAYSPDGQTIGVAGYYPGNGLWNASNGQLIRSLEEFVGGSGNAVAFSPDGTRVAIANSLIIVWDTTTGEVVAEYEEYSQDRMMGITSLVFSPDGAFLAAGYYDGSVRLWDVSSGQRGQIFMGHLGEEAISRGIIAMAISQDGRLLAGGECLAETRVGNSASCDEGGVSVWDIQSGELLQVLTGHQNAPHFLAFSPDGTRLLSAGWYEKSILVWDVATWDVVDTLTFPSMVTGFAFSPDGTLLATATQDVKVRDFATGEVLFTASRLLRPDQSWTTLTFSPDGSRLAVHDGTQIIQWRAGQAGGGGLPQILLALDDSPFSERITANIPADWRSSDPEGARFELRVTSATFQYDSCSYTEGHVLIRQGTNSTATLLDRASGRALASRTFNGPQFDYRACEASREFDQQTEYQTVSLPDQDEFQTWLVNRINWLMSASSLGWASGVNLRAEPNTSSEVLGVTSASDPVLLIGRNATGDWLRVRAAVGENGADVEAWIFRDLVTTAADIQALPVVE